MKCKVIAMILLTTACCTAAQAASPLPPDPQANGEEEEFMKENEEIDRMLREDDSRAPIDYGYGPGVLPPDSWLDMSGVEAPGGARPSGAGR